MNTMVESIEQDVVASRCQACGRPFQAARSRIVSDGACQGSHQLQIDGRWIQEAIAPECSRCVGLAFARALDKTEIRGGKVHREHLLSAGNRLLRGTGNLAQLEAEHLARLLQSFPGDWLPLDDLKAHPSGPHVDHILGSLPIGGSSPGASFNLGPIAIGRLSSAVPGVAAFLPTVLERLEAGDFGEVTPDEAKANEATLASQDGLIVGRYFGPHRVEHGVHRRIVVRAFVCLYPDLGRSTFLIGASEQADAPRPPLSRSAPLILQPELAGR